MSDILGLENTACLKSLKIFPLSLPRRFLRLEEKGVIKTSQCGALTVVGLCDDYRLLQGESRLMRVELHEQPLRYRADSGSLSFVFGSLRDLYLYDPQGKHQ